MKTQYNITLYNTKIYNKIQKHTQTYKNTIPKYKTYRLVVRPAWSPGGARAAAPGLGRVRGSGGPVVCATGGVGAVFAA